MPPADSSGEAGRAVVQLPSAAPGRFHKRLLTNRYLRHNTVLLGANILTGVLAYMLHPLLGHLMGVRAYGQVAALVALSLVLLTPTQLVATVAAKYASSMAAQRNFGQLNDFIRHFTVILLPVGIVIAVTFAAASGYVAGFFHLGSRDGVILLSLLFVVSCVTPLNLGMIQGLELFGWYAAVTILTAVLRLALPVSLVTMGFGVNGALLGVALGALAAYGASFRPLKHILRTPREPMEAVRTVWTFALVAAGAGAGTVALFSIDTVFARHYLDQHDAGLYAALATLGRTALFVTTSVAVVMFPKVVALHERNERHAHLAIQALVGALALASVIEAVLYVAPTRVATLLFGQDFAGLAAALPLYGLGMLLLAGAQILIAYFLAIGTRIVVLIILLACLLESALIIWRHETISQLTHAVVITNAALLAALLLVFWYGAKRAIPRTRTPLAFGVLTAHVKS